MKQIGPVTLDDPDNVYCSPGEMLRGMFDVKDSQS